MKASTMIVPDLAPAPPSSFRPRVLRDPQGLHRSETTSCVKRVNVALRSPGGDASHVEFWGALSVHRRRLNSTLLGPTLKMSMDLSIFRRSFLNKERAVKHTIKNTRAHLMAETVCKINSRVCGCTSWPSYSVPLQARKLVQLYDEDSFDTAHRKAWSARSAQAEVVASKVQVSVGADPEHFCCQALVFVHVERVRCGAGHVRSEA